MTNKLKICSLNAKCDELNYKCCPVDTSCNQSQSNDMPDSLVAAMLAVTLLPSKADIINVQNVKNKCVVKQLTDEISRVKCITDQFTTSTPTRTQLLSAVCELNNMSNLDDEAQQVRDILSRCDKYKLNYVDGIEVATEPTEEVEKMLYKSFFQYVGVSEYDAYFNGSSLTLVKKSLGVCPDVMTIPCVESLVLFFEHAGRKFINVNVDLGTLTYSTSKMGQKKKAVNAVVCFLKQYKDCGSVIMGGALGDLDYDTPQLLYSGDSLTPEIAQRLTAKSASPVPSDYPCDTKDSLHQLLEYLLNTCNAEHVPYSWLLQYLRVKGTKKCDLMKLVESCDSSSKSTKSRHSTKSYRSSKHSVKKDVITSCNSSKKSSCSKSVCGSRKCPTSTKCEVSGQRCVMTLNKESGSCCKNKYLVDSTACAKSCQPTKATKSCCSSCKTGKKCEGSNLCADSCDNFEHCDTLSVLKRELSLNNVLSEVSDVNNRFTGYYNHFNTCLDCKYPRGIFQAWAMCEDYKTPQDKCRKIANNSELLALDHVLLSADLKNNLVSASLSDLCVDLCGENIMKSCAGERLLSLSEAEPTNAQKKVGLTVTGQAVQTTGEEPSVPDYSGGVVKSFFANRVFCVELDFHTKRKTHKVTDTDESLHSLGLTSFWCALAKWNTQSVGIERFVELGIDQHPYFVNFFYDTVENPFASKSLAARLGNSCATNALLQVQKNTAICEHEFYTQLLNVLSEVDDRERFVINVGYAESLVRAIDAGVVVVADSLENIRTLFRLLDTCTVGEIASSSYLSSLTSLPILTQLLTCALGLVNVDLNTVVDTEAEESANALLTDVGVLGEFTTLLNSYILENCALMDVLVSNAVKELSKGNSTNQDLVAFVSARNGSVQPIRDALASILEELPFRPEFLAGGVRAEDGVDLMYSLLTDVNKRDTVTRLVSEFTVSGSETSMLILISELNLGELVSEAVQA